MHSTNGWVFDAAYFLAFPTPRLQCGFLRTEHPAGPPPQAHRFFASPARQSEGNCAIAAEIGVSDFTVRKARKATASDLAVDTRHLGRDGKVRRMPNSLILSVERELRGGRGRAPSLPHQQARTMFHRPGNNRRRPQPTATPTARPLALSDLQLGVIQDVARQIPPWARSRFLQELAARLRSVELADAVVHRVAFLVAREMLVSAGSGPWAGSGGDAAD
jgi:hypothetical protein